LRAASIRIIVIAFFGGDGGADKILTTFCLDFLQVQLFAVGFKLKGRGNPAPFLLYLCLTKILFVSQLKHTLVLGATTNPERYSYLAVQRLTAHQHPVTAIGIKPGIVSGIPIITEHPPTLPNLHTITLYLNPERQKAYYDYILSLHPQRLIFNPGTENEELEALAKSNGIQTIEACTLVLLSTGQY
jgi:uncharacterized protein